MKLSLFRILALGVVGAVTPVVAATSIRVSNFTSFDKPDSSLPIVLRDGALLPWGIGTVSVGYFNISDSAITDAFSSGQFLDPGVFTQIGPEVGFFFGAPVVDGMVDQVFDTGLNITSGSAIVGKSAYVIFGDQQSLADSG